MVNCVIPFEKYYKFSFFFFLVLSGFSLVRQWWSERLFHESNWFLCVTERDKETNFKSRVSHFLLLCSLFFSLILNCREEEDDVEYKGEGRRKRNIDERCLHWTPLMRFSSLLAELLQALSLSSFRSRWVCCCWFRSKVWSFSLWKFWILLALLNHTFGFQKTQFVCLFSYVGSDRKFGPFLFECWG